MISSITLGRVGRSMAVTAMGAAMVLSPMVASAQDATPAATPVPFVVPQNCTIAAANIVNPRGIVLAPDGTLYIAVAGSGGTDPDWATPMAGTPDTGTPATTHGNTGQIVKIATDGTQSVLVDGLTSYNFGTEVTGPAGLAIGADGTLYAAIGGPGPNTAAFAPVGNADTVVSINTTTGEVKEIARLGDYERTNNPDPNAVDSNLSDVAVLSDGTLAVSDAGGNDVLKVDPATGAVSVLAVVPGLPTADGSANPARGGKPEIDPVPTSLVADADGGVYVGLLTGAGLWGVPGSAKIIHVAADGTITDAATGLNMVTSITQTADGSWLASTFSANLFAPIPEPGYVSQIGADGKATQILGGLPAAYGITVASDGGLYVVVNSSVPGNPPAGMVLKCDVGLPAATPTS